MPRRSETRERPRGEATKYLAKGEEFATTASSALAAGSWNSAGLSAIHAGLSSADAALVASAGVRSISKDHNSVVLLLESRVPEFSAPQKRQLAGLLKMKNEVAYEERLLTEVEAHQLVDHASRLVRWARRVVRDHAS
jgi:hypothetical protein